MKSLRDKLEAYIHTRKLRWTAQRERIVSTLMETRQHLTTEELFQQLHRDNPDIGYATVARTLHLLVDAGVCKRVDIGDGVMRYELIHEDQHHDHLICTRCGKFTEVFCPELEQVQARLVQEYGFIEQSHTLQIFGLCAECQQKGTKSNGSS